MSLKKGVDAVAENPANGNTRDPFHLRITDVASLSQKEIGS